MRNETKNRLLIAMAATLVGAMVGQLSTASAATEAGKTETRLHIQTEYVDREVIVEIEIPVSAPFDYEQHASSLGAMHETERMCNIAVQPFAEISHELNTPMVCLFSGGLISSDYAGFYNGNVIILTAEGVEFSYYAEVAAHEIGHAYDFTNLTDTERDAVVEAMGWEQWDVEHYADVVAFSLGYWADYGDGWRHAGEAPTEAQIQALLAADLIPSL